MNIEDFKAIMEDENIEVNFPKGKDNALLGLNIIVKYCPNAGISGAGHDIIYSIDTNKLVEAGITKEDAIRLKEINWMLDTECDCLACFV